MIISWLNFGVALLKVAYGIMNWFSRRALIDEGRRQVILEYTLKIAGLVASKKKIQERIDAMSDAEVDGELRRLEPQ